MKSRTKVEPIDEEDDLHRIVALCHVGSVRHENQDFMGVFQNDGRVLFVVSDGMGGHHGGFEASRLAVATMGRLFSEGKNISPQDFLHEAIEAAHLSLLAFSKERPEMEGMGATVVAALVESHQAWIAHLGDSRAYLLRASELRQLTIDHTAINALALSGDLNPDDLANHPYGHILEQSLGGEEQIKIEVRATPLLLQPKDRLVLSTDGYWQNASDSDVIRDLSQKDLSQAVQSALDHALDCGGSDNITIGALETKSGGPSKLPDDARDLFMATARAEFSAIRPQVLPSLVIEQPSSRWPKAIFIVAVVLLFISILLMI